MSKCNVCDTGDCQNPQHLEKAYKPEESPAGSKVIDNMGKSLSKQMEDHAFSQGLSKALNARVAASLAKDEQYKSFRVTAERPIRHLGELGVTKVNVEPVVEAVSKSVTYKSCETCGIVCKSLQDCPRCTSNSKITEAKDWRSK